MYLPPRRSRGPAKPRTRTPRLISAITVGAVAMGVACGLVPAASAEPRPDQAPRLTVDIVGDSYKAGDGIQGTYPEPTDSRHRFLAAPTSQALKRLAPGNTSLRLEASIMAASGAVTTDFFYEQRIPDGQGGEVVRNAARRDRIRPDARAARAGFGANDGTGLDSGPESRL